MEAQVNSTAVNSGCSKRTYTAKEAASILGVSVKTIYNLCNDSPGFKVIRIGKGCVRIHKASFDMWLDSQE